MIDILTYIVNRIVLQTIVNQPEVNHVTVFFMGTNETMNILHKLTIRPVTISQEPNRVRWSKPEILTEPEGSRKVLQTMGLAFDQCWKCLVIYSLCH